MTDKFKPELTGLNDQDLDAVCAGSARPRSSNGGFSEVSGLGTEITLAEYREGHKGSWNVFMADIYNEPHD